MKDIKNRADNHLDFNIKAEAWMAKHFKHIFIASVSIVALSILTIIYVTGRYTSIMNKEMEAINNITSKVIVASPDGRVVLINKKPLSMNFAQAYLRNIVLNYLLLDGFNFIDSGVTQVQDAAKIPRVKEMLNFFQPKSDGFNDYYAYLSTLTTYYINNRLPEVIQPSISKGFGETFTMQDSYFAYSAVIPVITVFNYANKTYQGHGTIHVYLKGKIDMLRSTPENPFGLVITHLEVSNYVVKKTPF
ncbi:MAG TPA: hypothetical protein ENO30_03780 [Thermodesulfobium narugense]|nr:hypothetical protein [Thermodesulfobium narugense]